jgi:hypothetical protein
MLVRTLAGIARASEAEHKHALTDQALHAFDL